MQQRFLYNSITIFLVVIGLGIGAFVCLYNGFGSADTASRYSEPMGLEVSESMEFDVPYTAQVGSTIDVTGKIDTPNGTYEIYLTEDNSDNGWQDSNSIAKWEGKADCDGNVCAEIQLPWYVVGYEDMKMYLKDVQASNDSISACCAYDIIQFTCVLEVAANDEDCLGDQIEDPCEAVEVYGYGYPRYGDVMGAIEDCDVYYNSDPSAVILDEADEFPGREDDDELLPIDPGDETFLWNQDIEDTSNTKSGLSALIDQGMLWLLWPSMGQPSNVGWIFP